MTPAGSVNDASGQLKRGTHRLRPIDWREIPGHTCPRPNG